LSLLAIALLLLALVVLGIPIAIALGLVAVIAMITGPDGVGALPNAALVMFDGATSFPLIAIPLFILAGAIMNASGISRRLIAFASAMVGFIRGGLSMVTISASLFFAEISGSAVADVAALGSILIPAMKEKGYPKAFAAAVTSSSATLAVIIPPSIPMIIYGVMSGSSIVELFVAGIVPGVLGGGLMMLVAYGLARKHDFPREQAFVLQRVWETFKDAGWASPSRSSFWAGSFRVGSPPRKEQVSPSSRPFSLAGSSIVSWTGRCCAKPCLRVVSRRLS